MNKPYFPVFVRIEGRWVGVVGGGQVAERKVEALLPFGARIKLISPEVTPRLLSLAREEKLYWLADHYRKEYIGNCSLVISATDNHTVNQQVAQDCRALAIPCNVVDTPELCDFFFPALYVVDCLCIGITTGGTAPALSGALRRWLEKYLPPERLKNILAYAQQQRPHLSPNTLYALLEKS